MKFSCEKSALQTAALSAARAAAGKSPVTALEGLLIQAGSNVRVTGYDLKRAIYTTIEADVQEQGAVVINARLLCEMLRRMPDGVVTFSVQGETANVKCGRSHFDLIGMSADDYPELPVFERENGVSLPQGILKKMINECSFAISTNESRPVYTGALFDLESSVLNIVAVDGFRLALRRERVEGYGDDCRFVVPGTAVSDLERFCDDSEEKVELNVGEKYISFDIGGTVVLSRLLEGDFLNYKKAIPEQFRVNVKVDRAELLQVVDRVSLIVDEKVRTPLRLTFNNGAIDFLCVTPVGRAEDQFLCEGDGSGLEIGFNNRFLADALKAAPADELNFCLNTGSSPCILTAADGSDSFTYMILPVRLRAGQ